MDASNYSGKTTLSRIFRALETGRIPLNYVGSSPLYSRAEDSTMAVKLDQEIVNSGYLIHNRLDLVSLT